MHGKRLILNDTVTIEDGLAGYADGFLWCYFTGYTLQEAATIFFKPANTEKIEFQYGESSDTYEGYTTVRTLSVDTDGKVSVCLAKG